MYADANDMRAQYGEDVLVQLADAQSWDAAVPRINVELANASLLVDGYVAKYYAAAPGVPRPPLLTRPTCEIAYCDLHRAPTEDALRRKGDAMKLLGQIATGMVRLDQGIPDSLPARQGAVIVPDAERTFSRDTLRGF